MLHFSVHANTQGSAVGGKPTPLADHPHHGRQGAALHVLSAAYSPASPDEHRLEATAEALYLMMGRGLERLPVCAPRILAPASIV